MVQFDFHGKCYIKEKKVENKTGFAVGVGEAVTHKFTIYEGSTWK